VIFKQHRHAPLAQLSYTIGCARTREAVIVDPADGIGVDAYLLDAADLGLTVTGVIETHVHADYVSCARELADAAGAPHLLHAAATTLVKYPMSPFLEGHVFALGKVRMQALFTPGHTPEHACFTVTDTARAAEPWFVLTGDCLFVGDVGRPDLLLGDAAADVIDVATRARMQFASVRRLFALPDHVEVFPAHYGGSTCGGVNMSGKVSSTIGFERRFNLAMQQPDAEAFARFVEETSKPFPANYARIKSYNLGLIGLDELQAPR
jgi:glyoxylase-like metal-dependent hydrolase (beta-lactamase superfamily II)